MIINLKFEYRDLTDKELEELLQNLQGLSGGKIYSISKLIMGGINGKHKQLN